MDAWTQSQPPNSSTGVDVSHLRGYDTVLVPGIFTPWAEYLADIVRPPAGGTALDVGTGPGTAARVLAVRLGPRGSVLGADANPAMLALAAGKRPPCGGAALRYRLSPAAPLDVPSAAFDVVVCQQVLQFVPDADAALAEMRRAVRPGGRLAASSWTGLATNPLFAALSAAVSDVIGRDAGEAFARPWSLTAQRLRAAAAAGGWTSAQVTRHTRMAVIPSGPDGLMSLLASSGVADRVAALNPADAQELRARVHRRLAPYTVRGRLVGPTTASVLTAAGRENSWRTEGRRTVERQP